MLTVEDLSRELQISGALAYPWSSKARYEGTALDVACASKSATWRGTLKGANPKRRLHPSSVRELRLGDMKGEIRLRQLTQTQLIQHG
jgi:hypothetical protein